MNRHKNASGALPRPARVSAALDAEFRRKLKKRTNLRAYVNGKLDGLPLAKLQAVWWFILWLEGPDDGAKAVMLDRYTHRAVE